MALASLVGWSVVVQSLGGSLHLGDLPRLAAPLLRAGALPPGDALTRDDTWHHLFRTRLASHLLTLKESVPLLASGEGEKIPFDFWPGTVRERFGVSRWATTLVEGILVALFLFCAKKLRSELSLSAVGRQER